MFKTFTLAALTAALASAIHLQEEASIIGEPVVFSRTWETGTANYKLHRQRVSWTTAEETCVNEGGHLVSLHSQKEAQLVRKEVFAIGRQPFHIGLSRPNTSTLDDYTWTDGSPVDYLNWGNGEPNDNERYCAWSAAGSKNRWYDQNCGAKRVFVCKTLGQFHEPPVDDTPVDDTPAAPTYEVFRQDRKVNFESATNICLSQGGILPEPRSEEQDQLLQTTICAEFNCDESPWEYSFWLGMTRPEQGVPADDFDDWYYESDGALATVIDFDYNPNYLRDDTYHNWPSGSQASFKWEWNCAGWGIPDVGEKGDWGKNPCDHEWTDVVVCQFNSTPTAPVAEPAYTVAIVESEVNWAEAQAHCLAQGDILPEPRSAEDDQQLQATVGAEFNCDEQQVMCQFWLGITRPTEEPRHNDASWYYESDGQMATLIDQQLTLRDDPYHNWPSQSQATYGWARNCAGWRHEIGQGGDWGKDVCDHEWTTVIVCQRGD